MPDLLFVYRLYMPLFTDIKRKAGYRLDDRDVEPPAGKHHTWPVRSRSSGGASAIDPYKSFTEGGRWT